MARNDIHNVNSRPILITSVSRPVSNICQINNGLLLQAYNIPMQTVLYCHIHLSTAHSPLNLSHLPINPSILSTTHLPTHSHYLSGRPVYWRFSPLVYPAYAHHSTDKSISVNQSSLPPLIYPISTSPVPSTPRLVTTPMPYFPLHLYSTYQPSNSLLICLFST